MAQAVAAAVWVLIATGLVCALPFPSRARFGRALLACKQVVARCPTRAGTKVKFAACNRRNHFRRSGMSRIQHRRRCQSLVLASVAGVVLAACSSGGSHLSSVVQPDLSASASPSVLPAPESPSPSPTSVTSASPVASPIPLAPSQRPTIQPSPTPSPSHTPKTYSIDEGANNKTVTISRGDHVVLVLHNTYWTIQGSSNAAVLKSNGQPTAASSPSPCHPPGTGCGTVSQKYVAVASGTAHVRASRTSCGEALRCSPSPQRYDVTIVVRP